MAAVLECLSDTFTYIVESGDPRSNQYPLVSSPIPVAASMALYVTFTLYAPRYFRHKAAMSLKPVLVIYNLCMVVLSAYMFKEFLVSWYLGSYNMKCQPMDHSRSPIAMRMVHVCWIFYISKTLELSDTVFMVVRKKTGLTYLHVYHHCSVLISEWTLVKYCPSGHGTFHALCNCFVHTFMYTYYFMSSFPTLKKYLWWKKYLTTLQMIQFVFVIAHVLVGLYHHCEYPRGPAYLCLFECSTLLILFGNYYIQTYLKKQKAALEKGKKAM